ncbi:MAG: molybdopterin oxidoreductase family protein [Oligoflexus sp.]
MLKTHRKQTVQTTCAYCGVGCGLLMEPDTDAWKAKPDPKHPANLGRICHKGASLGQSLAAEGRILQASFRGQSLSPDQATTMIAERFQDIIATHGPEAIAFYVSGQMLTEDYYVANKFVKGILGTANIDTNSRLCMASTVAGHKRAFGADTVPGCYEDLDVCDLAVIVGSNMAACHPVLWQRLLQRDQPAKIIVIDPRQTATTEGADLHLPIKPGTDVALFQGLLHFLASHMPKPGDHIEGVAESLAAAKSYSITQVAKICQLAEDDIISFYQAFLQTEKTVSLFSQGVNQSRQGTDKVNSILNCHLYSGKIGKVGACPFSLTGQYNAMGGREVGGLANQLAAHMHLEDPQHRSLVQKYWQSPRIAERPGLKAVDLFASMARGEIKAIWIIATNPLVSLPNRQQIAAALQRCDFVIISECFHSNESLAFADMVLPASTWGEKDGTVTNSERCISRQRAFLAPVGDSLPDWLWICEVARKMGYAENFLYQKPADIFRSHAGLSAYQNNGQRSFDISGLMHITDDEYESLQPIQWPVNQQFPQGTARLFADGRYWTPSGKPRMQAIKLIEPKSADFPIVLLTGRNKDQWHSMTRTSRIKQLNQDEPYPSCLIHPKDLENYMLRHGLPNKPLFVYLHSPKGKLIVRLCGDSSIQRGSLFLPFHWGREFGENLSVNSLSTDVVDPISGQPELKWTPVRLSPCDMAYHGMMLSKQHYRHLAVSWWCRSPGGAFQSYCFADEHKIDNYWQWLAGFLNERVIASEWAYVMDSNRQNFRTYRMQNGEINCIIWLAAVQDQLDISGWNRAAIQQKPVSREFRQALLSGESCW